MTLKTGQVVERTNLSPEPLRCKCGEDILAGAKYRYWISSEGDAKNHVINCAKCERPKTLFQERTYLLKMRADLKDLRFPFIYGKTWDSKTGEFRSMEGPLPLEDAWHEVEVSLDRNRDSIYRVLLALVPLLPKCTCGKTATHRTTDTAGAFCCETHAPVGRSIKVEWYEQLHELGADL